MTILFQDSFDVYAVTADLLMTYNNDPGTIGTTSGRFGGGGWTAAASTQAITANIPQETEIWLSGAFELSSVVSLDKIVCSFFSAAGSNGGTELQLTYNATSALWRLYVGYEVTQLGTFTYNINSGWHWLDVHVKYDGSAGVFEVWIDDIQQINLTGQNTKENAEPGLIGFALGDCYGPATELLTWDDVFVYTPGTRLGDMRIYSEVPNSDASPNQGTPLSGGTHFGAVDEAQWSSANYITLANTSGLKEVFGQPGVSGSPTVVSVQVVMVAEKDTAGTQNLEGLVISNSTEGDGPSVSLTTSWARYTAIFEQDPHTSAPWTAAGVNAADIGFKVP